MHQNIKISLPISYKPANSVRLIFFRSVSFYLFLFCLLFCVGCSSGKPQEVVIYVSVDQVYAEPILAEFEKQTGIRPLPVYDVEAAKTTGLVNRLLAEKSNPQADVFWSGEFAQTILLKQEGILTAYVSPAAAEIPAEFKDPDGYWTGFGGRARVILVNTEVLGDVPMPDSIYSLLDPAYPSDRIGLAYPLFGTTATHAAALYALLGEEQARTFFEALAARQVGLADGNAVVRDRVANGQWLFGLTDTDDSCVAVQQNYPVKVIFPDQQPEGLGTLVIPNTVALVKGGPHLEAGRKLVDYLLSREVETQLVQSGWLSFPLRRLPIEPECFAGIEVKPMPVSLEQVYQQIERAKTELGEVFIR